MKHINLNPYEQKEDFIKLSQEACFSLDKEILIKLKKFSHYGNNNGFLLFRKLPQDEDLMPTPIKHTDLGVKKQTFISESILSIFGSALGSLYSYAQESNGSYFNNIRPVKGNESLQSSESSATFLDFHTEIAFHDIIPDYLLLYCLREDRDKNAMTGIASIRNALSLLDKNTIIQLRKPLFTIGVDYSFLGSQGRKIEYKKLPILSGPYDDPYMIYDADLMKPLNSQASGALEKLNNALKEVIHMVVLEAGDLIIIDNRRSIHARTHFKAYYDGQDRWLQRSFVNKSPYHAEILYKKKLDVIDELFLEYSPTC